MRQRPEIEQAAIRSDISRAHAADRARARCCRTLPSRAGMNGTTARGRAGGFVDCRRERADEPVFRRRECSRASAQASFATPRAEAERARAEAAVRLEVLTAMEQLGAARARQDVGRAAVVQARESQRMIRDRYEAGIAPAADVIRAAHGRARCRGAAHQRARRCDRRRGRAAEGRRARGAPMNDRWRTSSCIPDGVRRERCSA